MLTMCFYFISCCCSLRLHYVWIFDGLFDTFIMWLSKIWQLFGCIVLDMWHVTYLKSFTVCGLILRRTFLVHFY